MRLILVRHGQTVGNAEGINQGWIPGELNERGKKQAELLAKRLAKERIDIIYASDLNRVQETLAPLKRLRPEIKVVTTPALREENLGIFEGTHHGSVQAAREKAESEGKTFVIEGGEMREGLYKRVAAFIEEVIAKHRIGETVCLYTHGGAGTQITKHLIRFSDEEFRNYHPDNACFHILEKEREWKLVQKNVHDHLDDLEPGKKWDE